MLSDGSQPSLTPLSQIYTLKVIFLQKDLVMSKIISNFAAKFEQAHKNMLL